MKNVRGLEQYTNLVVDIVCTHWAHTQNDQQSPQTREAGSKRSPRIKMD